MELGLRSAIIISTMLHGAIAVPFYNHNLIRNDFVKKDPVIVDYVILKHISNLSIANVSSRGADSDAEEQKLDVKKPPVPENPITRHDKSYYSRKRAKTGSGQASKTAAAQSQGKNADGREAGIRSSRDYINYYGYLKGRIKERLQGNYRFYKGEGDVYLSFILNAQGALLSYDIDRSRSTTDEVLLHITGTSLKAVAPFSPLPKSIAAQKKMSFAITVSFKK